MSVERPATATVPVESSRVGSLPRIIMGYALANGIYFCSMYASAVPFWFVMLADFAGLIVAATGIHRLLWRRPRQLPRWIKAAISYGVAWVGGQVVGFVLSFAVSFTVAYFRSRTR